MVNDGDRELVKALLKTVKLCISGSYANNGTYSRTVIEFHPDLAKELFEIEISEHREKSESELRDISIDKRDGELMITIPKGEYDKIEELEKQHEAMAACIENFDYYPPEFQVGGLPEWLTEAADRYHARQKEKNNDT